MPRIIHTADLHIGATIDTAGLPPDLAVRVRANALDTFAKMCSYAVAHHVDAIVIAGDLFNTQRPADVLVCNTLAIMRDSPPVQFIIACGNHDPRDTCSAWNTYAIPKNVHIFPDNTMRPITPPGSDVTYWGHSWPTNEPIESPLPEFKIPDAYADTYNIVVSHASELDSQPPSWKQYAPFRLTACRLPRAHYVALGHLHFWKSVGNTDHPRALYPGTPCPDSSRALGPHSFALLNLTRNDLDIQRVRAPSIEFYKSALALPTDQPRAALKQYLSESLGSPPTNAIAHLSLIGTPTPENYEALPGIVSRCRPLFLYLHVLDFSAPPAVLERISAEDEPLAEYFAALDKCIENAETPEIASHFQDSKVIAMAAQSGNSYTPRIL